MCIINELTRLRGVIMLRVGKGSSMILFMGCSPVISSVLSKIALVIALCYANDDLPIEFYGKLTESAR